MNSTHDRGYFRHDEKARQDSIKMIREQFPSHPRSQLKTERDIQDHLRGNTYSWKVKVLARLLGRICSVGDELLHSID